MALMFATDVAEETVALERAAIAFFRSDRRCLNRSAGGEGGFHGMSPFFVYVVFR